MSAQTRVGVWLVALLLHAGSAHAKDAVPDTSYSQSFQCPESMATPEARKEAVTAFLDWARLAHPDWTLAELTAYRMQLLVEHRCEATLAAIRSRTQAESAPERQVEPADPEPTDSPMSNVIVVGVAIVGAFVLVRLTRRPDGEARG